MKNGNENDFAEKKVSILPSTSNFHHNYKCRSKEKKQKAW